MLFNSQAFLVFFVIVFSLYCVLSFRFQNILLLIASLTFYGFWDWRFVVLMVFSSGIDYVAGARIEQASSAEQRKLWLIASIASNLVILGFFKYFNFFVDSTSQLLEAFGFHVSPWHLHIILPLGISFYTFQSMAYVIDIYRKELKPAQSFQTYLLFVTFFPHLVAGPINRPSGLLRQVETPRSMSWDGWGDGAFLFLIGLFKKVCVADLIAPHVDRIFSAPGQYDSASLAIGAYLFAFQIYADFSGYSDMARGLAKMFGFELMINFNQPYFSRNPSEFWKRWHISLSTWLRDYLYIPLGGDRREARRTYLNLFTVMFLGGLWHGANWTYVVWGIGHGLWLAVHRWLRDGEAADALPRRLSKLLFNRVSAVFVTFHLVVLFWIWFRADSLATARIYLARLLSLDTNSPSYFTVYDHAPILFSIGVLVFLIDVPQYRSGDHLALLKRSLPVRIAAISILLIELLYVRPLAHPPFIYFQF